MIKQWTMATLLILVLMACGDGSVDIETGSEHTSSTPETLYFGQLAPSLEAAIFAPGVVSLPGRYEYAMSIHPTGDRLLFTVEKPEKGAAVFHSRMLENGWTTPARVDLTKGARKNEMEAFFTPDGTRIFFAPFSKGMDVRIWTAGVTPTGFADPQPLEGPIAEYPTFFPVQTGNGALYHTNLAERTVFSATLRDGRVVATESAGLGRVGHAFPSPDGSFILMDSASLDSDDQRDIFVSFREDDGGWSSPRALGPLVNTEFSETCPSLSPDGEFLFFSRYNEPGQISDLYWISSEVIALAGPV